MGDATRQTFGPRWMRLKQLRQSLTYFRITSELQVHLWQKQEARLRDRWKEALAAVPNGLGNSTRTKLKISLGEISTVTHS